MFAEPKAKDDTLLMCGMVVVAMVAIGFLFIYIFGPLSGIRGRRAKGARN